MMNIDAIPAAGVENPSAIPTSVQPVGGDFMTAMTNGIAQVNGDMAQVDQQLRSLAAGQEIPVHDLMIAMERARMGLTLMAEVRNRVIEGYQELTRMQL